MQKNIDYLLTRGPLVVLENINKIQNKVVKILDDTLNIDLKKYCTCDIFPSADFYEKNGKYIIEIDLPGVDIKHVDINLHGDKLSVSGQRIAVEKPKKEGEEEEIEEITYLEQGISYGGFERIFTIPAEVDESRIKATYKNGILTIKLHKIKESKLKKIKIEV